MKNQNDIYSRINDLVIEGLSKEGMQWFKPWKGGQENAPFNLHTKRYYNGFNIFMLNFVMRNEGYEHNQWLTFKQISEKGGKVIKGSKSTEVYFWQIGYFDNKTGKFVPAKLVKNINTAEQFEGKDRYRKTFSVRFEPNEVAEALVKNYVEKQNGFKILHRENSAYYSPTRDIVNMPMLETFVDADSYYKTLFHELAHSTGHKSRLNRKSMTEISHWGDNTYAKEELVAEISSWYLVGLLGLNPQDNEVNSQAYIKGWCKSLKDKPSECVFAMQQATKVVDYLQQ
jgi:antirestriction protein ArdC